MLTANFQECTASAGIFSKRLQGGSAIPSLHRLRWHCNCGILSLCIHKGIELNTKAAKKCLNCSCLDMSVVAIASPLPLGDGFFFAGQSDFLSAARFPAVVFFFVAEFQFGVLFLLQRSSSPARICIHFLNPELLCLLFWFICIEGNLS